MISTCKYLIMKSFLFVCVVLLLIVEICNTFETASFYGGSYITVPLQDAKSTTEIQLRFRTKQADALLFLAAGKTDYCLLKLQAGKLKVHINLGAGESELSSPKGLRLDDSIWHQVSLNRREGEVNLTIDKIHYVREKLPGRFFELNIYDGLFLGGIGDSLELFLGHVDWLRGCLSAVFYNGVDILKRARYRTLQSDAHGVIWSCASEFDVAFSSDISFVEEGAFLSLPNPISRTGVRWQFEMKTIAEDALLFYNSKSVVGGRIDYVGLEVNGRKLRLVMDTGSGTTEVLNEVNVSDGEWHLITVQINPTMLEITVDGKFTASSHITAKMSNKYLDLSDNVYVGGLELNKRANAMTVGMKSADKSFQGCLKNMEADGKLLGFPNARVTRGVLPNCVWSFECSRNPCAVGASCLQYGVHSFRCECYDKPSCTYPPPNHHFETSWKTSAAIFLEILSLNPIQVMEGEQALVTTSNINVFLDYAKYGIREAGVVFYVVQLPKHGFIAVGGSHISNVNTDGGNSIPSFSLLDITNDKVGYIHDGSENFNDSLILQIEFSTSVGFVLPAYLQGKNYFLLHIDVAPMNDPPFLFIPSAKVLRLAEGTRKIITADLLNATDSDNSNAELYYLLLNEPNINSIGYVERRNSPRVAIFSFSQEEVDLEQIVYVHNSSAKGEGEIALQVSDGILNSSRSLLKVNVYALQIHLANNTGIMLAHGSAAIISHYNLSFSTNAEDPFLDINYEITQMPKYGAVQLFVHQNGEGDGGQHRWRIVSSFTDRCIMREELRYVHTDDTASSYDTFEFKVSVRNLTLPEVFTFRITFVQLRLNIAANESVRVIADRIAFVNESHLKVTTEPLYVNSSVIVYTLTKEPKVSDFIVGDRVIKLNETWSQKDISENKLAFRLLRDTFSPAEDSVSFSVGAPQCQPIEEASLTLKYNPSEEQRNQVQVTLRPVQVSEGGQQPLLIEHMNIIKGNLSFIVFHVLHGPHHGWLEMHDVDHTTIEKRNVSVFFNTDIMKQRITYTHDDSESVSDAINFLAYGAHDENFQYLLKLEVEVVLKNDNPPYCVINKGLNVVVDGDKILSDKDLLYADLDTDTKPENIIYTRRAISNGAFTLSDAPYKPLFEFTQSDINNERVMFRHSGPLSANVSMWVSDGNHYSEFSFAIRASSPFVKLINNVELVLRLRDYAILSDVNLLSVTNINARPNMIRYKVTKAPFAGQLEFKNKAGEPIEVFTQDDVDRKYVVYRHIGGGGGDNGSDNDSRNLRDEFGFRVSVQDVSAHDNFHIRLFPEAYWQPLVLVNNKTQYVDEASEVVITREHLLIQQANVPPSDISYIVVEQPKYGYLEIETNGRYLEVDFNYLFHPNNSEEAKDSAITYFDQAIVDAEKLHYIQVILNQTYDRVVLDASNGIMWCKNIVLNFIIIPEQLYIDGGEVNVDEGGITKLRPELFFVHSPYYAERITEFKVKKFPHNGWLQFMSSSSVVGNISKWTNTQLHNQQIQYVHDGSETTTDSIILIAYAGEKESIPFKISIVVRPVNDGIPFIVNNTGATVWIGGIRNITNTQLAAMDHDTSNENLTFAVVSAQAGYLAYTSNLNLTVDRFTQTDVDMGRIAFVHSGEASNGEFDVVINDGKHKTQPVTFIVQVVVPTLHLRKTAKFQIFPMIRKAITAQHLLAWCSDNDENIVYMITSPPKYGLLSLVEGGSSVPVRNFTQTDINATKIWYQHTSNTLDSSLSNDSFTFRVVAAYASPIEREVFHIQIAVSSGGLDGMLDIETYEVEEGGSVKLLLNTTNIMRFLSSENVGIHEPSLRGVVIVLPRHGKLCLEDHCAVTHFTNEQMNSGEIIYMHDDSDSSYDNVTFMILLEPDHITLCNVTMRVVVHPINDRPFHLVQDAPTLSVVQGEKFVLTHNELLTTDEDTLPEEITYDIINGPSVGTLYVNGVKDAGKFTQADVNAGRVVYENTGPVQTSSFHFRVSDGKFPPTYKVFNIFVHAAKLSVTVTRPVLMLQTWNSTAITSTVFNVFTNYKVNQVAYAIVTTPRFGYISVNNSRNVTFSHEDLRLKRVLYVQTDFSVAGDAFELEAYLADCKVKNLWVNISVEPLIKIAHFAPTIGTKTCITSDILNAGALAKISNSNPTFDILKKPKYGRLQKIIKLNRKENDKAARERENRTVKQGDIDKFTYEEVLSKVIYYSARKLNSSVEDSFAFLLSAAFVQPAIGELKFHVIAESNGFVGFTTAPSNDKSSVQPKTKSSPRPQPSGGGNESGDVVASPNKTIDNYYYASLLFGIFIASLFILVLIKCRSKKRTEEDVKPNHPLPLPRPPDDLLPSSPALKRNISSHSTPPCMVIPLGTDSIASSEHDFNLRYPYGTADEDWNGYDVNGYSNTTNPMLRKNQYWV